MLKVCETDHENSRFVIFDLRPCFTRLCSFLVTKQNEQWQATKHNNHYHFQGNDLFSVMLFEYMRITHKKLYDGLLWKLWLKWKTILRYFKLWMKIMSQNGPNSQWQKFFKALSSYFPKNVNQVVKHTSSTIFSLFYWSKIPNKKRHLVLERHSGAQSNRFIIWRNSCRVLSAFNTTLFWTSHSPLLL